MSGDKRYLELLEEMKALHIAKNAGYSGDSEDRWANFRLSEAFGVPAEKGCLIRMSDKWIRMQNLVKNPNFEQVGESLIDTLKDLASYALIEICLLEGKTIPNEKWIKITKCKTKSLWYKNSIGLSYLVRDNPEFGAKNKFEYILCPSPAEYPYYIYSEDCEDLYG